MDRYTAQDMRQYLHRVQAWLGARASTDGFFVNAYGRPLTRNALSSYFLKAYAPRFTKRWRKPITLYSLRHTSATDWLDHAARQRRDVLPYVQRQLGHESLESTAIYTHVAIEPLRRMFKDCHLREQEMNKVTACLSSRPQVLHLLVEFVTEKLVCDLMKTGDPWGPTG